MIQLKSLYAENFRSWKKLDLKNMNTYGLCLICGSNGAGKSSIRQLIEYLLTDKISDGYSVTEIPLDGSKDCYMWCELQKENDIIYIQKYRNHSKEGNKIYLCINGDLSLTCSERKETQANIEKVLGINSSILGISTIFSSKSQSFPEEKDSDRKKIFYLPLELNKYEEYEMRAKEQVKKINDDLRLIEKRIAVTTSLMGSHTAENVGLIQKSKDFADELGVEKLRLGDELYQLVPKSIDELREKLLTLYATLKPIKESQLIQNFITKLNVEIAQTNSKIQELKNIKDSGFTCPILKTYCSSLSLNYSETTTFVQIRELETQLEILEQDLTQKTFEYKWNEEIKRENQTKNLTLKDLDSQIEMIKLQNQHIGQEKERLKNLIEKKNTETNPYLSQIEMKEKLIQELEKETIELKKRKAGLQELVQYYNFWVKGFGKTGIPNLKIELVLDDLEAKTNYYLNYLSNGNMFTNINSQTDNTSGTVSEKIDYQIHRVGNRVSSFESLSGGEKQRVQIADIFAFNSIFSNCDIMLLDEVLDLSLDDEGKEIVTKLLKIKAKELGSLFVISHEPTIKDQFDTIITIEKKNGESKLCQN